MRRYVEMRVEFQLLPLEEEVPGAHPPSRPKDSSDSLEMLFIPKYPKSSDIMILPDIQNIPRYQDRKM